MPQTLNQSKRDDLSVPRISGTLEPALYVAIEGERPLVGGLRAPLGDVDEVRINRGDARSWRVEGRVGILEIPDRRMSSKHARLVREDDGWLVEDVGSTNGTYVEGKRATSAAIVETTVVTLGATALIVFPAELVPKKSAKEIDATKLVARPRGLVSIVPSVDEALPQIGRVAMSKLSVLLLGESGAGKEVMARAFHELSQRSGPFVAINCGALAPNLVESQLFGYVKGAFSGALKDEPGLVRSSSGGTLFLDEIGELPPAAQATLLRVLQEKEVLPVGGTRPIAVDLRVVAATLKPIDGDASFRADLYARIAAFVLRLAPLRERRGDLGVLVADLLPRITPERAPRITLATDLVTALARHTFPLNVRELEHALSVATVTATEDQLRLEHVGSALTASSLSPTSSARKETGSHPKSRPLTPEDEKLRADLVKRLEETKGNVSELARSMSTTRMQIHRWMKRFGLDAETFRR